MRLDNVDSGGGRESWCGVLDRMENINIYILKKSILYLIFWWGTGDMKYASVCRCVFFCFLPPCFVHLKCKTNKSVSQKQRKKKYWCNQNTSATAAFSVREVLCRLQTTSKNVIWRGQCCICCPQRDKRRGVCNWHTRGLGLIATMCGSEPLKLSLHQT